MDSLKEKIDHMFGIYIIYNVYIYIPKTYIFTWGRNETDAIFTCIL